MTSSQRPKNKYSMKLQGIPSSLNINDRNESNPFAESLMLLERSLCVPIRIPIVIEKTKKDVIDFLLDNPEEVFLSNLLKTNVYAKKAVQGSLTTKENFNSILNIKENTKNSLKKENSNYDEIVDDNFDNANPEDVNSEKENPEKSDLDLSKYFDMNSLVIIRFVKVVPRYIIKKTSKKDIEGNRITKKTKTKIMDVISINNVSVVNSIPMSFTPLIK
jgi:hypothetical protein